MSRCSRSGALAQSQEKDLLQRRFHAIARNDSLYPELMLLPNCSDKQPPSRKLQAFGRVSFAQELCISDAFCKCPFVAFKVCQKFFDKPPAKPYATNICARSGTSWRILALVSTSVIGDGRACAYTGQTEYCFVGLSIFCKLSNSHKLSRQ